MRGGCAGGYGKCTFPSICHGPKTALKNNEVLIKP